MDICYEQSHYEHSCTRLWWTYIFISVSEIPMSKIARSYDIDQWNSIVIPEKLTYTLFEKGAKIIY